MRHPWNHMKATFLLLTLWFHSSQAFAQESPPQVGFFPQGMVPDFVVDMMTVAIPVGILFFVVLLFVPRRHARKIFKPWRLRRH